MLTPKVSISASALTLALWGLARKLQSEIKPAAKSGLHKHKTRYRRTKAALMLEKTLPPPSTRISPTTFMKFNQKIYIFFYSAVLKFG